MTEEPKLRFIEKHGTGYMIWFRKGAFGVPFHEFINGVTDGAKAAKKYAEWQKAVNRTDVKIVKTAHYHTVYIGERCKTMAEAKEYLKRMDAHDHAWFRERERQQAGKK